MDCFLVLDECKFHRDMHRKLFSIVCDEKRRWVFEDAGPRIKCKLSYFLCFLKAKEVFMNGLLRVIVVPSLPIYSALT